MKSAGFLVIATVVCFQFPTVSYANKNRLTLCNRVLKDAKLPYQFVTGRNLQEKIRSGKITGTIKGGKKCFPYGVKDIELTAGEKGMNNRRVARVRLTEEPYYILYKHLSAEEATIEDAIGYKGIKDPEKAIKEYLKQYFNELNDDTVLTVFKFKYIGD